MLTSPAPESLKGAPDPGPADGALCRAVGHWLGSSRPALPSFVTLDPALCGPYFSLGQLASYLALPVGKQGGRGCRTAAFSSPFALPAAALHSGRCSSFQRQMIPFRLLSTVLEAPWSPPQRYQPGSTRSPAVKPQPCGDPVLTPGYQQKLVGALPSKVWDSCLHAAPPSFQTVITPTFPPVPRSWLGSFPLQVLNPRHLSLHFHYHNHPISV